MTTRQSTSDKRTEKRQERAKKKLYGPILWLRFICLKATEPLEETFYLFYKDLRSSWYSSDQPRQDEKLSLHWNHAEVLSPGPLDRESSALTTRWLRHKNDIIQVKGNTPPYFKT